MRLTLLNHDTDRYYQTLLHDQVLDRTRRVAALAREKGLEALDTPDPLVQISAEIDANGRVTKNSLGVLDLAWQAAEHPEWATMIGREIDQIRAAIRAAHGVELRYLIWAGMGGSAEDKSMYDALGLLRGGVRLYILDSTDPAKLQAILADLARRGGALPRALRQTLVVGMAMGMTSYEPVVNLEKLHLLYRKHRIVSAANFIYMTLPGSLLDQFAGPRGYRRVELQPDNDNTTAGRHSGPLTRGSLYPLALNGVNLDAWIAATQLTAEEADAALRMAAFLHGNGLASRDKVMLLLPREWEGAGIWTKQDFEESLGKSEELGIKVFLTPRVIPASVFWFVRVKGCHNPSWKSLGRAGRPLAVLELEGRLPLPRYMQWVHHVVFAMGYLRRMNFVTQPSVELYKQITNELHAQACKSGNVERTRQWRALAATRFQARAAGGLTLYYDSLIAAGLLAPEELPEPGAGAAEVLAAALGKLLSAGKVEYLELTFYGDTRYQRNGRLLRGVLDKAGGWLPAPADVYEGPAMNHSYHEMIIGHGRCFSIAMLSRRQAAIRSIDYRADYHKAQWIATKLALQQRGRAVVALTLPDTGATARRALNTLFRQVARRLGAPALQQRSATI